MLFGGLLTNTSQIFAEVRTFWSVTAIERVSGWKLEGLMKDGAIHLINSGSCTLDGTGRQMRNGEPVMKPFWEITGEEVSAILSATQWEPASLECFREGGYSSKFLTQAGMPVTICRLNLVKGVGPVLQLAEGWTATFPEKVFEVIDKRTDKNGPLRFSCQELPETDVSRTSGP